MRRAELLYMLLSVQSLVLAQPCVPAHYKTNGSRCVFDLTAPDNDVELLRNQEHGYHYSSCEKLLQACDRFLSSTKIA